MFSKFFDRFRSDEAEVEPLKYLSEPQYGEVLEVMRGPGLWKSFNYIVQVLERARNKEGGKFVTAQREKIRYILEEVTETKSWFNMTEVEKAWSVQAENELEQQDGKPFGPHFKKLI